MTTHIHATNTHAEGCKFAQKTPIPIHMSQLRYRFLINLFFPVLLMQCTTGIQVVQVHNVDELAQHLAAKPANVRLQLAPGRYVLQPATIVDSTCGNCEDPATPVEVTVGLLVQGNGIQLSGPDEGTAEIVTNAGYGLFFKDCQDCSITGLSITGGQRDADGNATNAAIVVKNSSVTISNCTIQDNLGDSAAVAKVVAGVMGIAGREGGYLTIVNNRILRNSWDGIALYRGAEAVILDNVIDGVDKARGSQLGGGRGVGIGVTWDAQATIRGNLVTRYWKGIGLFVDANATVTENVVEDVLTWGIYLWDAGRGEPQGRIEWNAVYQTGACGVGVACSSMVDPERGYLRYNAIVQTAQNPRYDDPDYYCTQMPLAVHAAPEEYPIRENWLSGNRRAPDDLLDMDISTAMFQEAIRPLLDRLHQRPALAGSRFLQDWTSDTSQ